MGVARTHLAGLLVETAMISTIDKPGHDFRAAMTHLNLPQTAAAAFFRVDVSTIRRWAQVGPPPAVNMILAYLIAEDMTPDAFLAAIRRKDTR